MISLLALVGCSDIDPARLPAHSCLARNRGKLPHHQPGQLHPSQPIRSTLPGTLIRTPMCNLYQMPKREQIEMFISGHGRRALIDDYQADRPIGPRGHGLFLTPCDGGLQGRLGQWGLIRHKSPPPKPGEKIYNTNNARIESIDEKPTFRHAWRQGQRCLIPAAWYAEPNWETGSNIWWRMSRADGNPWFLAGLWDEWTHPDTGEVIPNYTAITCNCDGHPLLARLHKPDPKMPPDRQDKRSLVNVKPQDWELWLRGSPSEALTLIHPDPVEAFDLADAERTDAVLRQMPGRTDRLL